MIDEKMSFAPGVILSDGTDYEPEGWMWVLAFAVRGFEWAIQESGKPWFERQVEAWRKMTRVKYAEAEKACLEKEKAFLEEQIATLDRLLEELQKNS